MRFHRLLLILVILSMIFLSINLIDFQVNDKDFSSSVSTSSSSQVTRARSREHDTWSMFSHDLQHTGNSTELGLESYEVLWSNITGSSDIIYSSSIVYNGRVYVGTQSSYLYCFDEETGEKLWSKYFNKVSWGMCGSITGINSNIYIGSEDDNMYCLNPVNGNVIWSYTTGGPVWSCPAVVNGKVYFGSVDKYVYCLNESDGKLVWKFKTKRSPFGYQDYGISSSPAVANGKLFIGACDGLCYCLPLDDPNGDGIINKTEKLWDFNTSCYIYASPSVYNGKVYIGTGSYSKMAGAPQVYKLYCLDENTGIKTWEFTAGSYILSTPSIGHGRLFVGSLDGKLYCLPLDDPNFDGVISNTEMIWKFDTGNEIWGSVAIAGEKVYFGSGVPYWESGDGNYWVYCAPISDPDRSGEISSSEIIWSYKLNGGMLTTPAIVNGRLFISTYDGYVYCLTEDKFPPKIKSTIPGLGALDVPLDTDISVEFNEDINPDTLTPSNFKVKEESGINIAGEIKYDSDKFLVKFEPAEDLQEFEQYTVSLSSNIQDLSGNGLDIDSDGIFEPDTSFEWTFTTAKYPPILYKIPTQHPIEGKNWYLNMSNYTWDPNTPFDELVFLENSSYAEVKGNYIVFNYPNGITTEHVNISVTDGISTVWRTVLVMVKQTNNAPVISEIPDIFAIEDIDKIVELSQYIIDIDNEPEDLKVRVNTSYARVMGLILTFNYPNGILTDLVNITVDDGDKSTFTHVNVIVEPVNDPPIISPIPDQVAMEDIDFKLNITGDIYDIDNSLAELMVFTNSSYAIIERIIHGENTIINIIFNYPNGVLFEVVNLTVSDSDKLSCTTINITIKPVDDPPVISKIPVQSAVEDVNFTFDLSKFVSDIDTPLEDIWISLKSHYLIKTEGLAIILNYPNGVFEDNLNISVYEGYHICFAEVKVLVTPTNDWPILTKGRIKPDTGDTDTEFQFIVTYMDIDGDDNPIVEVIIDEESYLMTIKDPAVNPINGITYIYTTSLGKGKHTFYFRCNDNSGESNNTCETDTLTITVTEDSTKGSSVIIIAIISIIATIVIILVLILIYIKRKKRKKIEEIPIKSEEKFRS